jgi:hypothetical protein
MTQNSRATQELSTLALTQLRLDVEEAMQKGGHEALGPLDREFFDPVYFCESSLEFHMDRIGLRNEFARMRARAEARFPMVQHNEPSLDHLGMKGVIARAALWAEAADPAQLDVLDENARKLMDRLARRYLSAKSVGFSEFIPWAIYFAFTQLDDTRFDLLAAVSSDMGGMMAGQLIRAFSVKSLDAFMDWRAESGTPVVMYRARPLDDEAFDLLRPDNSDGQE